MKKPILKTFFISLENNICTLFDIISVELSSMV